MRGTLAPAVPRAGRALRASAVVEAGAGVTRPQCQEAYGVDLIGGSDGGVEAVGQRHPRPVVGCRGSLRSYSGKATATLAVRQIRRLQ